ncbi:MAG: membrane protein insertase YidC [Fimbriimonadaceae bacterium]|nr:membrane protein insertase YidC [Fimbriimonadaceae bacterium]
MAQPAQNPRSQIMQILLIGAFIFMAFQIFNGSKGPTDTRSRSEVWQAMVKQNREMLDLDIAKNLPIYNQKVDEDLKTSKLTADEAKTEKLKAVVLVSATQFRSGQAWNIDAKVDRAYQTLAGPFEAERNHERWSEPVAVRGESGAVTQSSAKELYGNVVADLSVRNEKAIVWGIFPGHALIDALVKATGSRPWFSYAFAGFLLAMVVRGIIWPLAWKQYMWGRKMSQLGPMVKEIQEKYKDKKTGQVKDQQAMGAETMALYKEYGINPLAGCAPMLIQMPLFLMVYQCMWKYKFDFVQGYFLWVHPGSQSFLGIPLAPNLGERDYILVFIYMVSMIVTTLLQPVSDPTQVRQQRMIGVTMAVVFGIGMFFWPGLPSAFVLYWIFTNILATIQALIVYRMPMPPLEKVQTTKGGSFPSQSVINVDPDFFGKDGGSGATRKRRK